jgi:hypothetical protein
VLILINLLNSLRTFIKKKYLIVNLKAKVSSP